MVKYCIECGFRQCFVLHSHSDSFIPVVSCTKCGLVYESGDSPPDDGVEPKPDEPSGDADPGVDFKNTYHRVAHLNERLSSAVLNDPMPPTPVMDLIEAEWHKLQTTEYFIQLRAKQGICKKTDIKLVLGSLDDQDPITKAWKNQAAHDILVTARTTISNPNPDPSIGFSILYLEKWKHLAAHLTKNTPPLYDYHQLQRVGTLINRFSGIWNRYQHPNDKFHRKNWVFRDRKHFPNFNFMFHRVHELLGPDYTRFNSEFPVPTNGQALKRLWRYWRFIAKKANVPFRGKDEGQGYNSIDYKQTTLETWKLKPSRNHNPSAEQL